jgi:hypothetical protein
MCLDIDPSYHPNYGKNKSAFIAEQPILVYKRLINCDNTHGYSPYQQVRWDFGVEMRVPRFTYVDDSCMEVAQGLHAFFTKNAERSRYHTLYPAVIPVGARFYIGTNGEIVATAMTVYKTTEDMLKAFGANKIGAPIPRHTLKKRRNR